MTAEKLSRTPRRRVVLRVAASIALLMALIAVVPRAELVDALRRVPYWGWALLLCTYLSIHLLGLAKWRTLLVAARTPVPWTAAAQYYYYGLFGNIFLPSVVGGDAVRFGLAVRGGARAGGILVGGAVDRFVTIVALTALAALGAWRLPAGADLKQEPILRATALLLSLALFAGLAALWLFPARAVPRRLRRTLIDMRRSLAALSRRPATILFTLTIALTMQGCLVGLCALLSTALGFSIPFSVWLFVWPLAKIAAALPITQGGIGVREATQVGLFAALGLPTVAALAVGLVFQATVIGGGLVAGGLALALSRWAPSRPSEN